MLCFLSQSFDEFDVGHVQHELLRALALAAQKSVQLQFRAQLAAASSLACAANAMPRFPPRPSEVPRFACSDSCRSLNSTAGMPAGV
jgi:hypothetical protein